MLVVEPDAQTDFWQQTHYGFRPDNGHFLYALAPGDFVMTTQVQFRPVHQYDQAGLMVRVSPDCWLKTSVEFEPHGASRLGAVVTNGGWSDWSTQDWPGGRNSIRFRVRRSGADYIIEQAWAVSGWTQIRMAHLAEDPGDQPVAAGVYACSPTAAGFLAEFSFLTIAPEGTTI